jgi:hypothetical protein
MVNVRDIESGKVRATGQVVWGGPFARILVWLLPQAFQQLAVKVARLRLSSRFLITSDRRGSPRPRDAVQEARSHPE